MTAIVTLGFEEQISFWTDAACYDDDGVVRLMKQKATIFLHLPAIVAARGSGNAASLAKHSIDLAETFDHVVEELPQIVEDASLYAWATFGEPINLQVVVGGYSVSAGGLQRYCCWYNRDLDRPELRRLDICELSVEPAVGELALRSAGLIGDDRWIIRDNQSIVRLMELQRHTIMSIGPDVHGNPRRSGSIVGGFVQETRLFADGWAETHIIHRWDQDRIGERLVPTGQLIDPDGNPIEGFNATQHAGEPEHADC